MRRATTSLEIALAGGYIGEIPVEPKLIADAIHRAITGRGLFRGIIYYYGGHDAELDELFGYTTYNDKAKGREHSERPA